MPCMTCGRPLNVCHGECGCQHQSCGCHHGSHQPATQYIGDLPEDTLTDTIDYVLGERDIEDTTTGNTVRTLVRVKGTKFFTRDMDNIITLETNNSELLVPSNGVRAIYIENSENTYTMKYADATHTPIALAIGAPDGSETEMNIQNSGFILISPNHDYIVGSQYYLGADGAPTTDSSVTGIKLFVPVSTTYLAINM